jgi:translocation and assembly module TamB
VSPLESAESPLGEPARDRGRLFVRILCVLFAFIGAIPLAAGAILQNRAALDWAEQKSKELLNEMLGLEAAFDVGFQAIPLALTLQNVAVRGTDSEEPALFVEEAKVSPRLLSLLAGRLDVGDIEIGPSRVRLVIEEGKIKNVPLRLPEPSGKPLTLEHSPFRSLALTSARIDLRVDGTHLKTEDIDIDVLAEPGLEFNVSVKLASAELQTQSKQDDELRTHTDRICDLELRARASPTSLTIKRLNLDTALELPSSGGVRPLCERNGPERGSLRLSQVEAKLKDGKLGSVGGSARLGLPLEVLRRFVQLPDTKGTVRLRASGLYRPEMKLPEVTGELSGESGHIGKYKLGESFHADFRLAGETIRVPRLEAAWGNGNTVLTGIEIAPFSEKKTFRMAEMRSHDVDFPGVMRDVGVTDHTIVDWHYDEVIVTNLAGTMVPFAMDAALRAQTSKFVVWNKGYDHPEKKRMIGVPLAHLNGRFRVSPESLDFYSVMTTFGSSRIPVELVSISFNSGGPIDIRLAKDSVIELADVGPIANLEVAGRTHLDVRMQGPMNDPFLDGAISVEGLRLDRYELGNLEEAQVHFEPLSVTFSKAVLSKKRNRFSVPVAALKFDGPSPLELNLRMSSERLELTEFLETLHFDEDPRFSDLGGRGQISAKIRYLLGGPEDQCDGGRLRIDGNLNFTEFNYSGETFSPAEGEFHLDWFDIMAGTRGMRLSIPSVRLSKGSGAAYGSAEVLPEGVLHGKLITTKLPLGRVDALKPWLAEADGYVSGSANLSGRIDALAVSAKVNVSEIRLGKKTLPTSALEVSFIPREIPLKPSGVRSGCGRVVTLPYTQADYDRDESDGAIIARGKLFGDQVQIAELGMSRQRDRRLRGNVKLERLDLGALAVLGAGALVPASLKGYASGALSLENFRAQSPFDSTASFSLAALHVEASGYVLETPSRGARFHIRDGSVGSENFQLALRTPKGQSALFDLDLNLNRKLEVDAHLTMHETPLAALTSPFDDIQDAGGTVSLRVDVDGTLLAPRYKGYAAIEKGKIQLRELKSPITDLELRIDASERGVQVSKGRASLGGGTLNLTGSAPITPAGLGRISLALQGREIALPLAEGVRIKLDTDLELAVPARPSDALPRVTGRVIIDSASYDRMMSMTADLASLTARGKKSEVAAVDLEEDKIEFDVVVVGRRPIVVKNDLLQAELSIDPQGVHITGTNQNFGAVGNVEVESGGKIFFRSSKFEIQRGSVRFNDPTRLSPDVEVHASTDFRRSYAADSLGSTTRNQAGSGTGTFRIYLNAAGPPDDLRVDLTSDPPLGQDDIFLLLTVGLTQAELARTQSAGVGSSVALEALGSLSGAESAVTNVVQVDEFRFGSTYSLRTGRTEPTVTIGKALSERVRASVTTAISDSNEVRSDVEFRANSRVSFQGSYDNSQRSGGPSVGNVGGDIRFRLEFD